MKSLFALFLFLAFALALAPPAVVAENDQEATVKKDCPLCKLPGRAALFSGKVRTCPAGCDKLCCTGTELTFLVAGMVDERCARKVTAALTNIGGVMVKSVSHETGQAMLRYDPRKVRPAQLATAIVAGGYEVAGQVVSFQVTGLHDDAAAGTVENALEQLEGVSRIETLCQQNGAAIVVFDPAKTSREKIARAINTTPFKVAKDG